MKAPSPCKYCGVAGTHLEFTCFQRPKKPIPKTGKITKKWLKHRSAWIKRHTVADRVWFCYICKTRLTRSTLTLDHIQSRSSRPDLRFVDSNLAPCCYTCNSKKGSQSVDNFI